ncbi:MAG: phosphoribosylaminoimidazolesuccinocarboxamide synthase [Planctomycetota bacterium]
MPHPGEPPVLRTELPFPGRREGKVRDVYQLPGAAVPSTLLIASDRLSAFDVVLPTPIPGKGVLLTTLSNRWFDLIEAHGLCPIHRLHTSTAETEAALHAGGLDAAHAAALAPRTTIVRSCRIIPIECVARGYLDGSGWAEYQANAAVCGVPLPPGLERGSRLPEPIFTPATKAEQGAHDENITFDRAADHVGLDLMRTLRERTLATYTAAHAHAADRGLVLADTKFEFGFPLDADGEPTSADPILADEVLTPDSSRYWPRDQWRPGGPQQSFDKQFVRDHLQALVDQGAWDKSHPGPELPSDVVEGTRARYARAIELLFPHH